MPDRRRWRLGCLPRLFLAAGLLTLPLACQSTVHPGDLIREEMDVNRALWLEAGIDHYRVTVQRICFCAFDVTQRMVVEVNAGAIVAVREEGTGELADPRVEDLYPGVSGLFDIIRDALDQDAHRVAVRYDPQFGYPVELSIDYLEFAVDEELTLNASDLVPLR